MGIGIDVVGNGGSWFMSYGGGGKESPAVGELELPRVARVPAREGENRPRALFSGLFQSGGDVELPRPRGVRPVFVFKFSGGQEILL
jgi:hypothetical protein